MFKLQFFHYSSELNKILGEKRGLYPEFVLDNVESEGSSRQMLLASAGVDAADESDSQPQPSISSPTPSDGKVRKPKMNSFQDKILHRVDTLRDERSEYHSKIIKYLENKEEREKVRDERAQRKLELLEKIAESLIK